MVFTFDPAMLDLSGYSWNPIEANRLPVWDIEKGGFRLLNLAGADVKRLECTTAEQRESQRLDALAAIYGDLDVPHIYGEY